MQTDPTAGAERATKAPDRFRTPESYIHWDRGLAIIAGMVGIVLLFFLLFVVLPIQERGGAEQITGTAPTTVPTTAPTTQAAASRPASGQTTAPTPVIGPDQPRLAATAVQFPRVRRGPGVNFAVIMNLQQGQRVEVVGRSVDRQWYQIVVPGNANERGWVSPEFLAVEGDVNTLPEVREN
jgi:hypothetical protein